MIGMGAPVRWDVRRKLEPWADPSHARVAQESPEPGEAYYVVPIQKIGSRHWLDA
jgi:hypothetical protein